MKKKETLKNRNKTNYSSKIFKDLNKKENTVIGFLAIDLTDNNKSSEWSYSTFIFEE